MFGLAGFPQALIARPTPVAYGQLGSCSRRRQHAEPTLPLRHSRGVPHLDSSRNFPHKKQVN
jgi:hypothetical protein